MGALLADVGKLLFAASLGEELIRAEKIAADEHRPDWEVEREIIGHSHMDVGAFLMGLCSCPTWWSNVSPFTTFLLNASKRIFLLQQQYIVAIPFSADGHDDLPELDRDYIDKMGAAERMPEWLKLYQELFITDLEAAANG